jgi:biotin transport system substrate-specific component
MMDRLADRRTLLATFVTDRDTATALRAAAVVLLAALTAVAAQISVPLPFTPVPFTLQPMVVLLGGAALGSRLGMASQILYLTAGLAGLPVFAASSVLPQGPLRLIGPTAGYLMAYPFAAFVTGWLAERGFDRRYLTSVIAMAAGLILIFAGGVTWLALFARPASAGFEQALRAGFLPFIPADIVKLFLAASILPAVWKITGRSRSSDVTETP